MFESHNPGWLTVTTTIEKDATFEHPVFGDGNGHGLESARLLLSGSQSRLLRFYPPGILNQLELVVTRGT